MGKRKTAKKFTQRVMGAQADKLISKLKGKLRPHTTQKFEGSGKKEVIKISPSGLGKSSIVKNNGTATDVPTLFSITCSQRNFHQMNLSLLSISVN
jgi:hypothetical protein